MVIVAADSEPHLVPSEHDELKTAMRVLGAVVEELSERVELLETRESLRAAAAER